MKAKLLKTGLLRGNANLYKTAEPVNYDSKNKTNYLIVSRANTFDRGDETMVFPADENGNILDWGDLATGYGQSHEEVLAKMDIEVEN